MKGLHLAISMLLFPISLVWYRKDMARGISPLAYWLTMAAWVVVNVAGAAWMGYRVMQEASTAFQDL